MGGIGDMSKEQAAKLEAEGAAGVAAQQAQAAAQDEAAREAEANAPYPRVHNAHTRWVDEAVSPTHEFVGTQYEFNSEAEALAKIDEARAAGKYVMFMDPENASYVAALGPQAFRVTVED